MAPGDAPVVLFVCVHNAGRSQMAAALLERHAGDGLRVVSAGSEPADALNPVVVDAMREIGIDLDGRAPRLLANEDVRTADVVVTMGCGDSCPIFPGKRYEDWELEDPAGKDLETVQRIRDEIDARVRALAADVLPTARA
jgi:arsenate reductase